MSFQNAFIIRLDLVASHGPREWLHADRISAWALAREPRNAISLFLFLLGSIVK